MTDQERLWLGEAGSRYAEASVRAPEQVDAHWQPMLGQSRRAIDGRLLAALPRGISVLEVGCGSGNQLACLAELGFAWDNLHGVDINPRAVELCRARGFAAEEAVADDLPYGDGVFDLVYTSALLIHVPPAMGLLAAVQREILRVSRRWVYGYEYHAAAVESRGSTLGGLLAEAVPEVTFKAPFCDLYLGLLPGLRVATRETIGHLDGSGNHDEAFLLEKVGETP